DCSPRHLSRLFQERFGQSPLDYLIQLRMEVAKRLFCTTDATIQEIADGLGYQDRYYFSRLFKKYIGQSPNHFKNEAVKRLRPNRLLAVSDSSIVARRSQSYIVNDNHYQYKRKGVLPMTRNWKNPSIAVSLLLMLALLLSACGGAANPST